MSTGMSGNEGEFEEEDGALSLAQWLSRLLHRVLPILFACILEQKKLPE